MTTRGEAASLFFGDARECKAWLGGLAVSNPSQSQGTLLDALRVFNRTEFDPLERLKCLELLRERNAFMLAELRTRHFSKPLPLPPADASAWGDALAILEEMEAGYRKCLSENALDAHAALISQRIVRYLGKQMLHHAIVYRPFDAALWGRLHQQYASAEKSGCIAERVKDSLESDGGSSVSEAYARTVLLQAAGLHEMTPAQVAFTEAVLRLWMRKVTVVENAPADGPAVCPIVVDLSKPQGAEAAPREALTPTQRVVDAEGLTRSLRRRVRALQGGDDVATLGLPPEVSAVDPQQALQRLVKRWSEVAPRPLTPEAPTSPSAGLLFGLADIHFFLSGGKAFEQPGKERQMSHQEKEDIAVFGRVTERTQSVMAATLVGTAAGPTFTVESWDVLDETVDSVRLRRRSSARRSVAVGRLVALRLGDAAPLRAGVVRGLNLEPEGLVMSIATFPGGLEATAVRGASPAWSQAVVLPPLEKLGVPRSLLVASGIAHRGKPFHFWESEAISARVQDILERGADFDRVTVA
jgi:hypothetical protein